MAEVSIRSAGEADAAAIARLHLASYRAAYDGLLPDAFLDALDIRDRERRWRDGLRDRARTTFVAEHPAGPVAALVAFAEVGPCREPQASPAVGELMALHVAARYWRRGVGGLVHGYAVRALARQGFESAMLWVLRDNLRARAFYVAAGWVPDGGERHRLLRGADVFEVRYSRVLGR